MFKRLLGAVLCICMLSCLFPLPAGAENTDAVNISGTGIVTDSRGFASVAALFDGDELSGKATEPDASLTLESSRGIGSLYIIFDTVSAYTVTDNASGKVWTGGENGFYHAFVDLTEAFGNAPTSVTLDFPESVTVYELMAFTQGQVPESVQQWQAPGEGETDLLLLSAHGDDEQLFFAGVLPYYAGELGCQVQVVYLTDHRADEPHRVHEMLNGLWAVGVRTYPIFGSYPDFLRKNDLEGMYSGYEKRGYSRDTLLGFVVENLRRFKPLVAVTHDVKGEYGHGMHMVCADLMMEAVTVAADSTAYSESAERYGTWDTPKTYLHLYGENPVVMDWDQPLENFDGMTAFQVTQQRGFSCHVSQYKDFAWYLAYAESAADVRKYSPCKYGLFRSTVGEDVQKNDFLENLTTYSEQARIEEAQRLEEERLAAEEAARLEEQARLEEEARKAEEARLAEEARQAEEAARQASEAARLEDEARQASEAARLEEEARQQKQQAMLTTLLHWGLIGLGVLALIAVILLLGQRGKYTKKRRKK